jgi:hypothetical protein
MMAAMMPRGLVAAILSAALLTPILAQAQPPAAASSETGGCLLDSANGRWMPSGMPELRRIAGGNRSPQIRHAGQIGNVTVYVTDFRCDHIEYEVILVGDTLNGLAPLLSVLRRIEQGAGFSNIRGLSAANLRTLEQKEEFSWQKGDVYGEIKLDHSLLSTILRANYVDKSN